MTPDQQEALKIQNEARKGKGLQPLQWDDNLVKGAQQWANHLAHEVKHLEHSKGDQRPNAGENLFWGSATPGPYKDPYANAAHGWMNEVHKYHGEKIGEGDFGSFGHYTQCMWKSTTHIGMAHATDGNGGVYVVGRYSPPGNWSGQKPY